MQWRNGKVGLIEIFKYEHRATDLDSINSSLLRIAG